MSGGPWSRVLGSRCQLSGRPCPAGRVLGGEMPLAGLVTRLHTFTSSISTCTLKPWPHHTLPVYAESAIQKAASEKGAPHLASGKRSWPTCLREKEKECVIWEVRSSQRAPGLPWVEKKWPLLCPLQGDTWRNPVHAPQGWAAGSTPVCFKEVIQPLVNGWADWGGRLGMWSKKSQNSCGVACNESTSQVWMCSHTFSMVARHMVLRKGVSEPHLSISQKKSCGMATDCPPVHGPIGS